MKRLSLLAAFVATNAALWGVADHVQAQTQVTGGISSDATWTVANAPYVLTGDVVVQAGVTLTIEPGVEVQGTSASNNDVELIVRGAVIAAGTENNPIVFKADSGDAVGHWEGIRFENTGGATMRHVTIKNADAALEFANPTADNFVFEDILIESYRSFGVNAATSGALSFAGLSIDGTRASTSSCMNIDRVALTLTGGWIRGCGVGVLVNNAALTLSRMIISDTTTDGIRVSANRTGTYPINITQSTFYGNNDAIQVSRSSSFSYNISLSIRTSIFEDNALVVRDGSSSSYRISFSTFSNNIWSGGSLFTNTNNPNQSGTMRYKALLADPENGDFEPTDRSPARSFGPANPELGAGAVPHAGAETGDGVHGWWYTDVTFPALSVTEVAGDMVIAPGVTVNFQPGATLEMDIEDFMDGGTDESRVEIRVLGTLEADGTISRPVRFTSGRDVPERGDWYGIVIFENTEAFNVAQVDLGYAVRGVSLFDNDHIVAGSTIHHCSQAGIFIDGGTPQVEEVELHDNQVGIQIEDFANATFTQVDIRNSTSFGVTSTHAGFTYTRGVIRDNGNDGIRATISRTGTVSINLRNLTIAHNAQDGVEFSRSSSFSYNMNVTISGCSITHNNQTGVRDGSSSSYRISTTCTRSNIWGNRTRISNLSGSSYTTGTCHDYNPLYADIDSRNYAPTIHSPNRKLGPNDGEIGSLPFEGAPGPQIMGYLWDDITFTADDSPYDVLGDLVVPNGTTVTFEPGAELRIVPNDDGMEGGGSAETEIVFEDGAIGVFESGDAPIVFTPDRDDPAPNDWQGFRFTNGQTTTLNNAHIEYANVGVSITGPTAPKIQDSLILYSQSAGVTAVDVTTAPLVDVLTTRIVGRGAGTGVQFSHSGGMVRSSFITHHATGILASLSKTRTVNLHFINNTIVHQATGIQYGRSSSFSYNMVVNAWNNVIAESTSNAIRDTSSSSYSVNDTVRNNNFFNRTNTSGAFNSNVGNITSDPLIEDDDWESFPRWFDGKLWAESLAINEGSASAPNLPDTDLAGNPRNLAGGVDIGAYEFDPEANREPRADAVETAIMVPRGESFQVDGTAAVDPDGFIASAFWTFIDGTVLPGLVVTHTLEQAGTNQWGYLTVIDDDGAEDHALVDINVNIRPVADAGPNVFQDEGPDESVFFDGTLSQDPDGTIVSWVWDFGDGTPPTSEASPRHSYLSAGLYTVTLTVTDNEGLTDTDVTIATVFGNNDTVGPLIQHNEIADGQPLGDPVVIRATIQDPSNVTSALLFHRAIGAQGAQFAVMTDLGNNLWEATIPGTGVTADGVEYWISASDGVQPNNNSSTSPVGAPVGGVYDFLVVGDPDPPTIQHTPIEDGQPVGEAVTVTTTITDATGVGSANIYFRPIGGQSFGARSMANINGDTWTAQIPAFLVTAPGVEYYFDATDTSPVPTTGFAPEGAPGELFRFTVGDGDNNPPLIAHTPIADGQPSGAAIAITAGIVDNGDVESATVHFRAIGGGAFQTAALTFDTGTTWRGQIPAQAAVAPGIEYYLSAEDDGENTSTNPEGGPEVFHTFTISDIDNAGPSIEHTPIGNGQPEFQAVTVAATIEDVSGIDFVKLHYRPIGLPIFQEATMVEEGGVYTGSIPGFAVSSPGVEYYIRAVDLESNTSVDPETAPGTPHTFSVGSNDEDAPTLVHAPIEDGQTAGQSVAIEATVFDPSDLDSVTLSYRLEGDQDFTELAMVFSSGTTWTATIPGEDVQPEGIEYFITAVDDSPNNNTSTSPEDAPDSVHSFTVLVPDDAPPVIEHTPRAQPLTFGFDLQINADITDDSGVESAILWYGYDAEQLQPRALVEVVDGLWGTTLAGIDMPDGTREIRYTIEATDTQDNTAELPIDGVFTVSVVTPDTTAPEVSLGDLPDSVEQGSPIEVSVTATDTQSGVATVRLFYRTVGADNFAVLATTEAGDSVFTATIPGDVVLVPGVEIFAEADDIEANTANTDTVTVGVTPPPDVTSPTVSVEPIADGQPAGQAVTVLAQATDDSQPVTAALFFRAEGSNGNFTELAMGSIGDGLFSATIDGNEVQVPGVEYYVQATDASDNSATAPSGAPGNALVFEVTPDDTSGPTIGHAVPGGPLESGPMLTIEATVLDPSDIGAVTVFWRTQGQPDFQTVTLTGNGDLFSGDIGPLAAPSIEYYIEATDGLDNASSQPSDAPASVNTIEVRDPDLDAPTIDHTPIADGREPGLSIEVSADITDPSGVASATLFYRPIGGPAFGEAIMARSGDTWTAQIPGVVINEPGVEYYIQAVDSADAPNTGTLPDEAPQRVLAFSVGGGVIDQTPPTIDHTPIDAEQAAGTEVEISATITDDTGVAEAQVFFRGQGEDRFLAVPMEASGDVFTAAIPAIAVVTPGVEYYIEATDASPRGLVTVDPADAPDTVHSFDVPSDVPDAPVIDLQDIDSPQQAGTPLAIVATITDPDGIDRAEAFYRADGDDAFTTLDLDNVQGDRYEAMLPGDDVLPEFIEIFVEAEDTLGNISVEPTGDPLMIVIESEEVDQTPPTIVHSPPSGGLVGRAIELQAIVTDATGVDSVKIRFRQSGEDDFVSVDMDQDGDRWSGVIPAFAAQGAAVEYYLEAIDTSPDTNVSTDPEAAPDAVHMVELIGDNPDMDAGMDDTGDEPDAVDMPDADEPDAVDPDVVEPDNDADNGPTVPPVDPPDEEGCGCQTPASPASPVGGAFGLLALLALVVLRRR